MSTQPPSITIQGVKGSFHEEAALNIIPDARIVECHTFFPGVFDAVLSGASDYGIVAVENNVHGSIGPVYRLLERHDLWIVGESLLKIEQHLIGHPEATIDSLNHPDGKVFSHMAALSQCELWLDSHLPLAAHIEYHDTADAVRMVMEEKNPRHAAIAGTRAAEIYGGTIIARAINDEANNFTRFVLLQKAMHEPEGANRTSMILTTADVPGALHQALGVFVENGVNLSKIDSRPIANGTRRYKFYVDFDAALTSPEAQKVLMRLAELGSTIKILGSYKADTAGRDACSL